jgi:hypothetical protein
MRQETDRFVSAWNGRLLPRAYPHDDLGHDVGIPRLCPPARPSSSIVNAFEPRRVGVGVDINNDVVVVAERVAWTRCPPGLETKVWV